MASEPTTATTCGKIDCTNPSDFDDITTPLPTIYFNAVVTYTLPACPNPADTWTYFGFMPFWLTFDDTLGIFTGAAGTFTSTESEAAATESAQAALDSFVASILSAGTLNCGLCNILFYSLVIGLVTTNTALLYTALDPTLAGVITLTYVNAGINQTLLVTVASTAISVRLATNGGGVVTTTTALLKAAVQASAPAMALVTVASWGTSNDTGVVLVYTTDALWTGGGDAFDCYALGSAVGLPNSGVGFTASWIVTS